MKKLIFITFLAALSSCSKEWNCTMETNISGYPAEFDYLNINSSKNVDFHGTKKEMEAYENSAAPTSTSTVSGWEITTSQTIECN